MQEEHLWISSHTKRRVSYKGEEKIFGALGSETTQLIENAAGFYSAKNAVDKGACQTQLVQRVQVALLHEVGKRLLAGIQAEDNDDAVSTTAGSA